MSVEIERKFLVRNNSWQGQGKETEIRQGYLSRDIERTVRVRTMGQKAFLTIKGRNQGAARAEFEYEIPCGDALFMLQEMALKPVLEKTRTVIEFAGHTWEVDRFFGDNAGLVTAEVELSSEDEPVELPDWVGREVTGVVRYYNSALSERSYSAWSEKEKAGD